MSEVITLKFSYLAATLKCKRTFCRAVCFLLVGRFVISQTLGPLRAKMEDIAFIIVGTLSRSVLDLEAKAITQTT
jgi:hypothetical protein